MSLRLTAHQPVYMPWGGLIHKIAEADVFCVFDAVQYSPRSWENRNWIKSHAGPQLLTVPVKSGEGVLLRDAEIAGGPWARKHMRAIQIAYSKAPHFEEHYAGVGAVLDLYAAGGKLAELNLDLLRYVLGALGLQRRIVRASDLALEGTKSSAIIDMCLKLGASRYIFGSQGRNYADVELFRAAGIEPLFQRYEPVVYPQLHGSFVPRLCVLDALMNLGSGALATVRAGGSLERAPAQRDATSGSLYGR